ncbi:hypothetical protein [Dongshaea marina]|uniref:hypothetical protein n=1 Tax=Dongshaea marina TaxID=2047966 RepID=UPI000D3E957A|nr:hypothetical protein [Dongshaea marina]
MKNIVIGGLLLVTSSGVMASNNYVFFDFGTYFHNDTTEAIAICQPTNNTSINIKYPSRNYTVKPETVNERPEHDFAIGINSNTNNFDFRWEADIREQSCDGSLLGHIEVTHNEPFTNKIDKKTIQSQLVNYSAYLTQTFQQSIRIGWSTSATGNPYALNKLNDLAIDYGEIAFFDIHVKPWKA